MVKDNLFLILLFIHASFSSHTQTIRFELQFEEDTFCKSISLADLNHDGNLDLYLNNPTDPKIYWNSGNFYFHSTSPALIDTVYFLSAFNDFNADGNPDLLLSGNTKTKIFYSDSTGQFTDTSSSYNGKFYARLAEGDVNNDGRTDFLVTGLNTAFLGASESLIFLSQADSLVQLSTPGIIGLIRAGAALVDVNSDGLTDVFISGHDGPSPINHLYLNQGNNQFSEAFFHGIPAIWEGAVSFCDVDNDGDQDVLISGGSTLGGIISAIYVNDGAGVFTRDERSEITGFRDTKIIFEDFDNDGDQDLFISGTPNQGALAQLYANDGLGVFSLVDNPGIDGLLYGGLVVGDLDNDGRVGLAISGSVGNEMNDLYTFKTRIYRNTTIVTPKKESATIEIIVYPNPCSTQLTIRSSHSGVRQCSIYDSFGRICLTERWDGSQKTNTMNIELLESGMYFLVIHGENTYHRQSIVKL